MPRPSRFSAEEKRSIVTEYKAGATMTKIAEKYVHKGDKLYIEGRIRYRYYDDKNGQRRFVTEIYADNMEILTSKQQTTTNTQNN